MGIAVVIYNYLPGNRYYFYVVRETLILIILLSLPIQFRLDTDRDIDGAANMVYTITTFWNIISMPHSVHTGPQRVTKLRK